MTIKTKGKLAYRDENQAKSASRDKQNFNDGLTDTTEIKTIGKPGTEVAKIKRRVNQLSETTNVKRL